MQEGIGEMDMNHEQAWRDFFRKPDEQHFEAIYARTHRLVYTICHRTLHGHEDALDAFQSTYTRLLILAREGVEPSVIDEADRLIRRLAVREADALRKRRGRRAQKEFVVENLPDHLGTQSPSPAEKAGERERRAKIEALIDTLPDKFRLPLLLHYFDGMTHDEIARTLAVPRSTITHRLKKGMNRLEPLLRRAGLAESSAILTAIFTGAHLIAPPSAIAASTIFTTASSAAANAGAGSTFASTSGHSAATIISSAGSGSGAMKVAAVALLAVIATGAAIAINQKPPQPQAPVGISTLVTSSPTPTVQSADQIPQNTPDEPAIETPSTEIASSTPEPATPPPANSETTPSPTEPEMLPVHARIVWDDDRTPVQGAEVTFSDDLGAHETHQTTDANGEIQFMARHDSLHHSFAVDHPHGIRHGIGFPALFERTKVIPIKRGVTLTGRIWDRNTRTALANTEIKILESIDAANRGYHSAEVGDDGKFDLKQTDLKFFNAMREAYPGHPSTRAVTQADGSFEISKIHPAKKIELWVGDNYLVSGEKAGDDGQFTFSAVPGESVSAGDLTVYAGGIITGRVTDAETGEPLRAALNIGNIYYPGAKRAVSETNGHYKLQRLKQRIHDIEIRDENHIMQHLAVSAVPGKTLNHDIKLRPGTQLTVTVVDEADHPIPNARITQESRDGSFTWFTQRDFNDQGVFVTHEYDIERRRRISVSADGYKYSSPIEIPQVNDAGTEAFLKVVMRKPSDEKVWFTGTVRSAEGKPLQGVRVEYATQLDTGSSGNDTKTDAFGRYQLATNPIDPMSKPVLTAYGKGWAPQSLPNIEPGSQDFPAITDFTLTPGRWLKVHVQDTQGNPLPDLHVSVRIPVDNYPDQNYGISIPAWRKFRTDANGNAELHDLGQDPHIISVWGTGITKFQQLETDLNRSVTYTVQPVGYLRGNAFDAATGDPIPSFRVRLSSTGGVSADLATTGLSFNDPSGHFEVGQLALGGRYTMTVIAEGYSDQVSANNIAGSRDIDPVRLELTRSNLAHGILVDAATGRPLPGVAMVYGEAPRLIAPHMDWHVVTKLDALRGWGFVNLQPLRSDDTGRFTFDKGANHSYVFVDLEPYQRSIHYLGLATPADKPVRIEMKHGYTLSGRVSFEGKPVEARHMFIQPTGNRAEGQLIVMPGNTDTDDKGRFSFNRLTPGRYLLDSGTRPAKQGTRYQRELEIDGDTTLDVGTDLGPHTMQGRVLLGEKLLEDVTVNLTPRFPSDFARFSYRTEKDGQFEFEGLLPGNYQVQVYGGMDAPRQLHDFQETIMIDGNIAHDIQIALHRELTITIVDANGSPELSSAIGGASLFHKDQFTLQSNNPMQLTDSAAATVQGNTLKFNGRFLGEYNLMIYFKQGEQYSTIPLVDPIPLDNLDANYDAGQIRLPAMATARVKIVQSAGDTQPLPRINVVFDPLGALPSELQSVVRSIDPQSGVEQPCALIPVGDYTATLRGVGISPDPVRIPVTIAPGSEPLLEFSLSSMASVLAVALRPDMDLDRSELKDTIQISRATLTGNGVNITLTGQPIDMNNEREANRRMEELRVNNQSVVLGPVAAFRKLEPGAYQLRIEADGYAPLTRDVEAVMGEPQPIVFNLEP